MRVEMSGEGVEETVRTGAVAWVGRRPRLRARATACVRLVAASLAKILLM